MTASLEQSIESKSRLRLVQLWRELVDGHSRVVDGFCSDQQSFLVLAEGPDPERSPHSFSSRNIEFMERILCGECQKSVALDFAVAPSTVAITVGECLRGMGVSARTSRVPMLLVMAAQARRGAELPAAWVSETRQGDLHYRVVSSRRPDEALAQWLSPAECAVARLLLEGRSYAEMAEQRRTSVRTIANQLAATFQKLGVSGRYALLHWLLQKPPVVYSA